MAGYHTFLDNTYINTSVHNTSVHTIDGGPGQGDYLLCRGRNGFSGGAEPAEVSNHYIHPHSGFTYLDVKYLYIICVYFICIFVC